MAQADILLGSNAVDMQGEQRCTDGTNQNESELVMLENRRKAAEKKRKYREGKRQSDKEEESLEHRRKEADYKRQHRENQIQHGRLMPRKRM